METSPVEQSTKSFWTFVVSKTELSAVEGLEDAMTVLRVEGYFLYITMFATKEGKEIDVRHLTPKGTPLKFEVPPWFLQGKLPEDITSRDIMEGFAKLFSTPFELIPPPPLDVPMEKIPPSRRKGILKQHEKTVKARFGMPEEA